MPGRSAEGPGKVSGRSTEGRLCPSWHLPVTFRRRSSALCKVHDGASRKGLPCGMPSQDALPRMPLPRCPSGPCSVPSLKAPSTYLNHPLKVHEAPSKTMRYALMGTQEAHSRLCLRLQGSPGKVATCLPWKFIGRSAEGQSKVAGRPSEGQAKVTGSPIRNRRALQNWCHWCT